MPSTSKQEDTLNIVLDRLSIDCEWALTGGTSFILQGVDYETSDIDIQTGSERCARKIMDELSEFVEEELYYRESEKMRSYFGVIRVKDVKVEVMGEVQKKVDGEWEESVKIGEQLETVDLKGREVPVLNLKYEAKAYRKMGRKDKAEKLEHFTKQS